MLRHAHSHACSLGRRWSGFSGCGFPEGSGTLSVWKGGHAGELLSSSSSGTSLATSCPASTASGPDLAANLELEPRLAQAPWLDAAPAPAPGPEPEQLSQSSTAPAVAPPSARGRQPAPVCRFQGRS